MIQEISDYDYYEIIRTALREELLMAEKTFIVYKDVPIEGLTDAQAGQLFKAMVNYSNGREVTITDPEIKGMWRNEKQKLDNANKSYKDKTESNRRAAQIRWEREREANKKALGDVSDNEVVSSSPKISKQQGGTLTEQEKADKKPVRHKYGAYKHVLLTDEQYKKLCSEHGEQDTKLAIQKVDDYCEETGKTYKNYLLVLNRWGYEGLKKPEKKKNQFDFEETNGYNDDDIAKMMFNRNMGC